MLSQFNLPSTPQVVRHSTKSPTRPSIIPQQSPMVRQLPSDVLAFSSDSVDSGSNVSEGAPSDISSIGSGDEGNTSSPIDTRHIPATQPSSTQYTILDRQNTLLSDNLRTVMQELAVSTDRVEHLEQIVRRYKKHVTRLNRTLSTQSAPQQQAQPLVQQQQPSALNDGSQDENNVRAANAFLVAQIAASKTSSAPPASPRYLSAPVSPSAQLTAFAMQVYELQTAMQETTDRCNQLQEQLATMTQERNDLAKVRDSHQTKITKQAKHIAKLERHGITQQRLIDRTADSLQKRVITELGSITDALVANTNTDSTSRSSKKRKTRPISPHPSDDEGGPDTDLDGGILVRKTGVSQKSRKITIDLASHNSRGTDFPISAFTNDDADDSALATAQGKGKSGIPHSEPRQGKQQLRETPSASITDQKPARPSQSPPVPRAGTALKKKMASKEKKKAKDPSTNDTLSLAPWFVNRSEANIEFSPEFSVTTPLALDMEVVRRYAIEARPETTHEFILPFKHYTPTHTRDPFMVNFDQDMPASDALTEWPFAAPPPPQFFHKMPSVVFRHILPRVPYIHIGAQRPSPINYVANMEKFMVTAMKRKDRAHNFLRRRSITIEELQSLIVQIDGCTNPSVIIPGSIFDYFPENGLPQPRLFSAAIASGDSSPFGIWVNLYRATVTRGRVALWERFHRLLRPDTSDNATQAVWDEYVKGRSNRRQQFLRKRTAFLDYTIHLISARIITLDIFLDPAIILLAPMVEVYMSLFLTEGWGLRQCITMADRYQPWRKFYLSSSYGHPFFRSDIYPRMQALIQQAADEGRTHVFPLPTNTSVPYPYPFTAYKINYHYWRGYQDCNRYDDPVPLINPDGGGQLGIDALSEHNNQQSVEVTLVEEEALDHQSTPSESGEETPSGDDI